MLSPEGFASILWKDSKRASEAAEVMKLTAADLKRLGMIEKVIEEPDDFSDSHMGTVCQDLDHDIREFIERYGKMKPEELTQKRYERFRNM